MANQLKMATVQSILSLHAQGWSQRRIATAVGVDRELLESPILNHANDTRASATQTIGERARVEVPTDINSLQQTDHKEAIAWRQSTRSAFRRAMSAGLTVKGFVIDDCAQRGYYLLDRR